MRSGSSITDLDDTPMSQYRSVGELCQQALDLIGDSDQPRRRRITLRRAVALQAWALRGRHVVSPDGTPPLALHHLRCIHGVHPPLRSSLAPPAEPTRESFGTDAL